MGRTSAATPCSRRRVRGRAHVVPVRQELFATAAVLDADDAGLGELTHCTVDGVDRAAQAAGQGLAGRHPATGAVPVAKQERVEAERAVGDRCVDHPFGHDREPRLLDEEGAGVVVVGFGWWRFWGHDMTSRLDELRVGMAGSTAGLQGASASGMRQEMRRNCTDRPVQTAEPAYGSRTFAQVRNYSG